MDECLAVTLRMVTTSHRPSSESAACSSCRAAMMRWAPPSSLEPVVSGTSATGSEAQERESALVAEHEAVVAELRERAKSSEE